jgi:starch synthase (maltosyl-transferring)
MSSEPRLHPANVNASSNPDLADVRFAIEDVYPSIEGGRYPVKRIAGQTVEVWADIFRDGHDVLAASLLWRREDEPTWRSVLMQHAENDRWLASFIPEQPGRYVFAVDAWTDRYGTWRRDFLLKRNAGQPVDLEAREGRALLDALRPRTEAGRKLVTAAKRNFDRSDDAEALLSNDLAEVLRAAEPRADLSWSQSFPLVADPPLARFGSWYEFFPRSQGDVPGRHGTFDDCIKRLPEIAQLGFDVVYLPPIHPIGRTNRKGRNNSATAAPDDPGSPYAIGSPDGGHDALHPQLGTMRDFRRFVDAARQLGLSVALDFAIQCSPDHPWLKKYPHWFKRRPDGSIRYAENPPKKYEDIVNPDLYCDDRVALWAALRDVTLFWIKQGVRVFRVDNPHTKPFPFWEWLIRDIQSREPGIIFLSEAFTRPKVMKALAKLGFTQSYTYFTWRTGKEELSAYLSELTRYPEREYFRPNFFVNTPDILPVHLQSGEPWIFKARVALAATLSSNYGVYSGFELLEHEPIPGREEYLDSEKYEIKVRDWNKPGNIKDYIGRLNHLRRANGALQQTENLRFVLVDDDLVLGYVKESVTGDNAVGVAVCLSGERPREFWFHFGDMTIGPPDSPAPIREIENLVTGERRRVEWNGIRLRIDPAQDPALIFRCLA